VILDVVYNHLGPEGNYLGSYGPFFTERYRTPWGGALNYDDAESDEVRRYFIDNALHWVTEYHLDGLRLDAVHAIFDFGARHVLEELASAVREQGRRLGREVVVIGESDLNDPRVVRPADRGGWGLDGQWSDDFHHAVHAALTGEREGYYSDFGSVAHVAKALRDRFVYDGRYAAHRRRRHGAPCGDVPGERFVVCIQNHDQVGNRAAGERLSALLGFEQQKLAAALMLLSPYVPMLFMGEEYGEANPFQYFVSHGDEQLVEAVRKGRRKEFEAFGWGDDVPDPQSEETFARSRLDPDAGRRGRGAAMRALYRDLLALRRTLPALRPGAPVVRVDCDESAGWVTMLLGVPGGGDAVLAAFNLAGEPREVPVPQGPHVWTPLVDTASETYGGPGGAPAAPATGGRSVTLAPHAAAAWRASGTER
jgi:maltooligosyltrehalose trehalohydrolase